MKTAIKNIATYIFGFIMMLLMMIIPIIFIYGSVYVASKAIPILEIVASILFGVCLDIFIPMSLFRFTRPIAANGLLISSYVFGALLWLGGVAATFNYWSYIGLIIGILFFGVGVVPLAMIASALHGEWWEVLSFVIGLVCTFGSRILAIYLSEKMENDMMPKNHTLSKFAKIYVWTVWFFIAFSYAATVYYEGWQYFVPGEGHNNVIFSFLITMVFLLPGLGLVKLGERIERKKQLRLMNA